MPTSNLGRLQEVSLREIWPTESDDFTPWLGQEENLRLLGATIGLELELESQEREVGPFRADLLCKNTVDDSWVLIENQIERTDHTHLGQILTYAAGLEVVTVVWVAKEFTDQHRAALDWLNENTLAKFAFFGLEVELWRIGDSPAAPKFNVVSKPNDWSRTVQSTVKRGDLTEKQTLRLRYWTAFRDYMANQSSINCQDPGPRNWMIHPIGMSGANLASIASLWNWDNLYEPENRVELVLRGAHARQRFAELEAAKADIEREVGSPLFWYGPEDTKSLAIAARRAADISDESLWPEQFEWLRRNLELFARVFGPRVKAL